jgi:hypothetical protein
VKPNTSKPATKAIIQKISIPKTSSTGDIPVCKPLLKTAIKIEEKMIKKMESDNGSQ